MDLPDEKFFFNDKLKNNHINVGTGVEISIKKLVSEIANFFDIKGSINFDINMPEGVKKKLLDISKISSLGWAPQNKFVKRFRANNILFQRKF